MAKQPITPGRRVRGSTTGRPIMAALDLLGRRMALRVIWELRGEPLTFRALAAAAGASPSVLNARLTELRDARLITHEEGGYQLTPRGAALLTHLAPLNSWAEAWAKDLSKP
jgi:DNA-binding HxlR family transcriptional regulator